MTDNLYRQFYIRRGLTWGLAVLLTVVVVLWALPVLLAPIIRDVYLHVVLGTPKLASRAHDNPSGAFAFMGVLLMLVGGIVVWAISFLASLLGPLRRIQGLDSLGAEERLDVLRQGARIGRPLTILSSKADRLSMVVPLRYCLIMVIVAFWIDAYFRNRQ